MIWNHRVFKNEKEGYYTIRECFYYSNKEITPHSYTEDAIAPGSDTLEGLKWVLEKMMKETNRAIENEKLVLSEKKIDEYLESRKSSFTRKIK